LSQDASCLRPSLLPGLLGAVRRNKAHHAPAIHLFELGNVLPVDVRQERTRLGIILCGAWLADWRTRQAADLWVLKGLVEALAGRLCDAPAAFEPSGGVWGEAGRFAAITVGGVAAGVAGQVNRAIAAGWDVDHPVFYAELDVDALLSRRRQPKPIALPSPFPPVKRDMSVLVDDAVRFQDVERTIREVIGARAGRTELIDRFAKGAQIPPGKHSLTFSIEYRGDGRTLTADEADAIHHEVGQALQQKHGAALR
jgi:phenylalanyl-tRNA synthetase beta chain